MKPFRKDIDTNPHTIFAYKDIYRVKLVKLFVPEQILKQASECELKQVQHSVKLM